MIVSAKLLSGILKARILLKSICNKSYALKIIQKYYSVHWGINPPSFLPSPPLNQQTVQAPLFRQSPSSISFFHDPSPPKKKTQKSRIFQ